MNKNYPSVSILTLSLTNRFSLLKILAELIKNQNYKNIIEWIIVGDNFIIDFDLSAYNINIKYINSIESESIGTKLNIGNSNSNGDLIILMNDDDYYYPNFINNCVNKLVNSNKLLIGTSIIYIYDFILNKTFKVNIKKYLFGYKKEYLIDNSFPNTNNEFIEKFTNNFTNMEEILPECTLIKFIHNDNKFYNKELLIAATITNIKEISLLENNIISNIIPNNYYKLYYEIFNYNESIDIDYDIVYLTGGFSIIWDPIDHKLGGSEQAVIQLSENWIKLNKKVCVYGNFLQDKNVNGVEYVHWTKFPFNRKFKILILWRKHGILFLLNNLVKYNKLIIDFHDNFCYTIADLDSQLLYNLFNKVTKFNFKSNYHKKCFIEFLNHKNIPQLPENKYNIIVNGIRIDKFLNTKILNDNNDLIRQQYRFCYCSSYDRGLENILTNIWPIIYKNQPLSELHVYYGMDYIFDDNFKNNMKLLLSQEGVMDHGRQPMEIIIREKYLSNFHLYINESIAEIDCISIKESLVTGCIPIISNFGVFKERDGIHIDLELNDNVQIASIILNYMNNKELSFNIQNQLKLSDNIINWYDVSKLWLNNI